MSAGRTCCFLLRGLHRRGFGRSCHRLLRQRLCWSGLGRPCHLLWRQGLRVRQDASGGAAASLSARSFLAAACRATCSAAPALAIFFARNRAAAILNAAVVPTNNVFKESATYLVAGALNFLLGMISTERLPLFCLDRTGYERERAESDHEKSGFAHMSSPAFPTDNQ
jgi:hypothetical protein